MNQTDAARAVRRLRAEAEAATAPLRQPDVDALVEAAATGPGAWAPGRRVGTLIVPTVAAAAALIVLAFGLPFAFMMVDDQEEAIAPPEHVTAFVDSLYDDEGSALNGMAIHTGLADDYLNEVWTDVIDQLAASRA